MSPYWTYILLQDPTIGNDEESSLNGKIFLTNTFGIILTFEHPKFETGILPKKIEYSHCFNIHKRKKC